MLLTALGLTLAPGVPVVTPPEIALPDQVFLLK